MGNIVWLASYPKSGNTWMRAFIENYLRNPPAPVAINTLFQVSPAEANAHWYEPHSGGRPTTELDTEELCRMRPLAQAEIARRAHGTVFVKTHNFLGEYKGHVLHNPQVTAGAIYIVRNPLDVVVSMANYFALELDEAIDYLAEEMTGTPNEPLNVPQIISSWSTHVQSWTANPDPSVLVVRYEDLLDRPQKAFAKVVSFLKQPRDPKRLKKAIRFSAFDQLARQERKDGFVERHEDARRFFRKGGKHQWREVLSDDQVARVVDGHREAMARFKYLPPGFQTG